MNTSEKSEIKSYLSGLCSWAWFTVRDIFGVKYTGIKHIGREFKKDSSFHSAMSVKWDYKDDENTNHYLKL